MAEKAFTPRTMASAESPPSIDLKRLFRSWDADGDGSLSVLEMCWGLRQMGAAATSVKSDGKSQQKLPPIMMARIIKHLEVLTTEDKNPDWQFLDSKAFRDLLFTAVPDETSDTNAFLSKYANLALLDIILPRTRLSEI